MYQHDLRYFRHVRVTLPRMQLVSQHLNPHEDVRTETHKSMDQVFVIVGGSGTATVGKNRYEINTGDALVVPMGTSHNLSASPLGMDFWTAYAPSEPGNFEHKQGEIRPSPSKIEPIADQLQEAADALANTDYAPSIGDLLERIEQEGPAPMLVQAAQQWIEFAHIEKGVRGRRSRSRSRGRRPRSGSKPKRSSASPKRSFGRKKPLRAKGGRKPKGGSSSSGSSSPRSGGSMSSSPRRNKGFGKTKKKGTSSASSSPGSSPKTSRKKRVGSKSTKGKRTSRQTTRPRSASFSSLSSYSSSSAGPSPVSSPRGAQSSLPRPVPARSASSSSVSSYSSSSASPSPVSSPRGAQSSLPRPVPAPVVTSSPTVLRQGGITTTHTRPAPNQSSTVIQGTSTTKIDTSERILIEGEIQINHYPW